MATQIQKKVPVTLAIIEGGPKNLIADLNWDPANVNAHAVGLDLTLFVMGANGKFVTDDFFIFYNKAAPAALPVMERRSSGQTGFLILRLPWTGPELC